MTETGGDLHRFGEDLGNVVNPMWLLRTLPNNVLCHVGIRNRLKGANACITNHSCGGTLAVIEAMEALRTARRIARSRSATTRRSSRRIVLYYHQCGLLARDAIRPFDASAHGSLFGEGAGALALETESAARARATRRSARCWAAVTRARDRACSRSATTATAWPARSSSHSRTRESRRTTSG
jgi:3-oxoacyl-[acyl-carrier-protein] synthase-1